MPRFCLGRSHISHMKSIPPPPILVISCLYIHNHGIDFYCNCTFNPLLSILWLLSSPLPWSAFETSMWLVCNPRDGRGGVSGVVLMACRLLKPDHTHTLLPPQHQTDSPSFFFLGCSASDKDIRTHTHMHAHTHIHLNAFIILHVDAVVLILFGFTCPFYYHERHFKSKYKKNSLSFNGALPNREGLIGCPVSQFAPSYPGDDCRLLLLNYYNI